MPLSHGISLRLAWSILTVATCETQRFSYYKSTLHYPTELIYAEIMVLINVSCELNEEEKEDGEIVNLARLMGHSICKCLASLG